MYTRPYSSYHVIFFTLFLCSIGISYYWLWLQKQHVEQIVRTLEEQVQQEQKDVQDVSMQTTMVVAQQDMWRNVQEKAKDTVVQVFSQIAEINLLLPFKTPNQRTCFGSAFFIDDQGTLITNAHVVNQATAIWVQIPSLGKRIIDVELIGLSPDHDIALLRVTPEHLTLIKEALGAVPFLPLGDSDTIRRADEVLALGYPLGQQSLKSTTGIISGTEGRYIQMSAAINPGNSGGPLLNNQCQVVGVNSAGVTEAQNIGYIIPINIVKNIKNDLEHIKLLRKPFLGVLFNNADENLTEFLGNPQPGGCYVVEIVKGSTLHKAGVERGDMLYEINGHRIDVYGEMTVPWSEDKQSIVDYVSRLSIGDSVHLVLYRKGTRKEVTVTFSQSELPAIRKIYPGYEPVDYEVVAGMVVMELSADHIRLLVNNVPGLTRYIEMKHQSEPTLVITNIFPDSQLFRTRTLAVGTTINEVNGIKVGTLKEFREAIASGANEKFLTIKATDNVARASDNVFVALPYDKILHEEERFARAYRYAMTDTTKQLIAHRFGDKKTGHSGAASPFIVAEKNSTQSTASPAA